MRGRHVLIGTGMLVAGLLAVGASGRWVDYSVTACGVVGCETSTPSTPIAVVLYSVSAETAAIATIGTLLVAVGLAVRYGPAWTLVAGIGVVLAALPFGFPVEYQLISAPDLYVTLHGAHTPRAYLFVLGALGLVLLAGVLRSAWIERQIPAARESGLGRRRSLSLRQ